MKGPPFWWEAVAGIYIAGSSMCCTERIIYQPMKKPMTPVRPTRAEEPLPLGTAILSNVALSLLMWNIVLRVVGLILAA
jgi:hypothetical protein